MSWWCRRRWWRRRPRRRIGDVAVNATIPPGANPITIGTNLASEFSVQRLRDLGIEDVIAQVDVVVCVVLDVFVDPWDVFNGMVDHLPLHMLLLVVGVGVGRRLVRRPVRFCPFLVAFDREVDRFVAGF